MLFSNTSRSSTPGLKQLRGFGGKGNKKQGVIATVPNQPSEASAHFMFELAKTVLTKAGGSSSTALFTHPTQNNNPTGPHRNLHLCAFQIGLYALGLHNCVSPNWLSRTYSSHVSWITGDSKLRTNSGTGWNKVNSCVASFCRSSNGDWKPRHLNAD